MLAISFTPGNERSTRDGIRWICTMTKMLKRSDCRPLIPLVAREQRIQDGRGLDRKQSSK
jgi:hypothetical protein